MGLTAILDQKDKQKVLWMLAVLVCFSVILFLNILTPMIADDFAYLYVFGEREQVSSLSDLIRSQITHYHKWGGRSVVHFIAQGLLQMPRLLVDILNSLVYILFTFLIYKHIKGRSKENSPALFILINLAVWFIIPMFGDTILWTTGSANYLWGTTIILAFMLPYRLYEGEKHSTSYRIIFSAIFVLFGVIAGWTNENSAAGMIVIILLFFLYYKYKGKKIPIQLIIPLIGVMIGYVMMIKAPGNFSRGGEAVSVSLYVLAYRLFTHTQNLFLDYGLLIMLYVALIILYNRFGNKSESSSPITLSVIYVLGGLAAIYAMIFSPQFPARAWFGIATFFIIALGMVLFRLNFAEIFIRKVRDAVILIASICFLFSFYLATKDIYRLYRIDQEREILAKEARESGAEKCYFEMFTPHTTYVHGEDSESNLLLSYYYGIYIEYGKK